VTPRRLRAEWLGWILRQGPDQGRPIRRLPARTSAQNVVAAGLADRGTIRSPTRCVDDPDVGPGGHEGHGQSGGDASSKKVLRTIFRLTRPNIRRKPSLTARFYLSTASYGISARTGKGRRLLMEAHDLAKELRSAVS